MSHFLGIDVGTSATKAVVCDARGRIVREASADHPISRPREGWSEQDCDDWWSSCARAVRMVAGSGRGGKLAIDAIGLSGQMHGAVLLGADPGEASRALRPAILWNDQRTSRECDEIERCSGGRARLVKGVGNAPLTGFTLPKLLWVRRHEPAIWRRVRHVVLPKDYIRLRLTGLLATDFGDAGGTLLLDVRRRAWNFTLCERLAIDPAILPPILESGALAGTLTRRAARTLGLEGGTPVVAGSGDNMTGAVGAGVVRPGVAMAMLGTSGVVLVHCENPVLDLRAPYGRFHAMCSATGSDRAPGQWCVTGVMLSAAGSLAWCRDTIAPGVPIETLMREAGGVPAGCDGLVFLPYLTGERCPHPDPAARGAWVGLSARHTRGHLVRAVVEGVTFGMAQILALVRGSGAPIDRVHLSGGGNRDAGWRRMQADIYARPCVVTDTEQGGSALGAAILAGVGAGAWPSVRRACEDCVGVREVIRPSRARGAGYDRSRAAYESLYDRLRPVWTPPGAGD